MGSLTVRLPNSTHEQLKRLASREGVSINQLVLTAVAEKVSALRTAQFIEGLAKPVSRKEFEAALAQVPDADPDPWDVWTRAHGAAEEEEPGKAVPAGSPQDGSEGPRRG